MGRLPHPPAYSTPMVKFSHSLYLEKMLMSSSFRPSYASRKFHGLRRLHRILLCTLTRPRKVNVRPSPPPVPNNKLTILRGLLAPPNYNAFTSITMNSFSSQCAEVASSVVYLHTYVVKPGDPTNGQYVSTLKEIAFWRFDDEGAVLNYDAWIPNLPLWFSKYSGVALDGTGLFSVVAQKAAVTNLCTQVMKLCTGSNQQYSEGL